VDERVIAEIVGIYSDPKHIIFYTSDSEAPKEFPTVLTARARIGAPTPSNESKEVRLGPAT
jgi:hypothetical protein